MTPIERALRDSLRLQEMKRACRSKLFDVPVGHSGRMSCGCVVEMLRLQSEGALCLLRLRAECHQERRFCGTEKAFAAGDEFIIKHQTICHYDEFHAVLEESFAEAA
jgi:hypothetical protein